MTILTKLPGFMLDDTANFTFANVVVTDNISSNNANLGNSVTANFFTGNGSLLSAIAGSNITGQVGNALISGTVYTNAQPNITSVGSLTSLTVTGNVSADNANLGNAATANFFIGNGSLLTGLPSGYANSDVANYLPTYTGNITAGNANITGTTASTSKTTGALTVAGGLGVAGTIYNNRLVTQGAYGNTILNEFTGIYNQKDTGTSLIQTTTNALAAGVGVLVIGDASNSSLLYSTGNLNFSIGVAVRNEDVPTGGTTPVTIASTGIYTTGIVNAAGNINSLNANLGNLATANFFTGNGILLSAITGSNVTGQVGNALIAGTVYTNAQPNITSVGTLTSLIITGNANSGNINTTDINASGNALITGNLTVSGTTTYINVDTFVVEDPIIELGAGVNGAPLITNDGKDRGTLLHYYTTSTVDAFMGWDNSNAEFAFGSNVTVASDVVTFNSFGNVRASYFIGNGALLTGLPEGYSNTNVAAYLPTYTGLVSGTLSTQAQPNVTSVGTLTGLTISGNASFIGANTYFSNISNVKIPGGSANYVIATDGSGNLSWTEMAAGSSANVTVDTFSGNGVANSFTLSVTPTSTAYVFVNINGVFQYRSSYSLVGNIITLGSTPFNGSTIEVSSINAGAASGGGGGNTSVMYSMGLLFGG